MNEYLDLMNDDERNTGIGLAASVNSAADTSPEEAARQKRISELLNVPPKAVEGDPDTARKLALRRTIETNTQQAPALAEQYTHEDFMRLAHDESANLGLLERTARNLAAGFGGDFVGSGLAGIGHTLKSLEHLTGSKSITADTFLSVGKTTKEYWQSLAPTDQKISDQVVRGVGQIAGQIPSMFIPGVGMTMMYGQGADQMYDKIAKDKMAQKAGQLNQDLEILSGGAITAVTEWASNKLLLGLPQVNMLKSRLLNRALQIAAGGVEEGVQETMENIGQDVMHIAATNHESKVAFGEALEQGGVGGIVGLLTSGVIQGAFHIRARGMQKAFSDLSDVSKVQKLRERDPGTYQGLADAIQAHLAATADGPVENIYIDANQFEQALKQQGVSSIEEVSKHVPSVAEQFDEAKATGGDVIIPLNEFVGKIAGTDVGDTLTPHLRATPDSPSMAEVEAAGKISEDLQAKADKISRNTEEQKEFIKSAGEVRKIILDQITATGVYSAPVSRAYATLVRDFYVNAADSNGINPMDVYKMFPYKVQAGDVQSGVDNFNQSGQDDNMTSRKGTADIPPETNPEAVGGEEWRDTSKWDVPEEIIHSEPPKEDMGQFDFLGMDFSEDTTDYTAINRRNYIDKILSTYTPPVKSKFMTQENVDEISTAILALKEGKLSLPQFNFIIDANLPLPEKGSETRGSGRYGDLYLGENVIQESMASFFGSYLAGKVQRDNPFTNEFEFHNKTTKEYRIEHDPSWDKFNAGWSIRYSDNYSRGGFATEQEAKDFLSLQGSGKPVMDDHGPEVGGRYYQAHPETYDKLIVEFRKNPTKLLRIALTHIKGLLDEDAEAMGEIMRYYGPEGEFNPEVIARRNAEEIEKRRKSFKVIKNESLPNPSSPSEEGGRLSQAAPAGKRGGFDPSSLTTILTQKADYSTFLHETAHFFLTAYSSMATDPNASPRTKADMQTLLDWFGIDSLESWNALSMDEQRKHHEAFAYNFENYLFEGRAPNPKLQSIFERFTAWLKRTYKSIRDELNVLYKAENGADLPILTGEVRQVMDRMIASDEQIKQAEQIRGMNPLFRNQQESGMSNEEWAAYEEMQKEAHESAMASHRAASLRQLKWVGNAKGRILKEMQKQAKAARKTIMADVVKEVNEEPIYKAHQALKEAGDNLGLKMAIADTFGYTDIGDLYAAINKAPSKADRINALTDQRMLEEHGDLSSPEAMSRAVDNAIHNEARARFIGVELRHLSKSQRPVRVMQEAARQAARAILGKRTIETIHPYDFSAAEARAAVAAEKAMKEGDTARAVQLKEYQLLQNQLAAEAMAIARKVTKAGELFKKVFGSDKRLGASRDMNYVETARAILANYGVGYAEQPATTYLEKIKQYDPDFYVEIESMITAHLVQGKPLKELTVEEFQDLTDQVTALWHLSRRSKQIEIDGKLMERTAIIQELNSETLSLGLPATRPGYNKAMSNWDKTKLQLMGVRAVLRRVEAWVSAMDRGNPEGPFRRYVWNPISEAVTSYRMAKVETMTKYIDILKGVEPLLAGKDIAAPEIGYTFKPQELLHALLHTGNLSNKRKLLLGREWGNLSEDGRYLDSMKWDSFIERAQREGVITKDHWDFCQKVWDLLESMKPAAQKAHRDMYGFYFSEITATPIETPWGTYAGGYVPAMVDPYIVTEGAMRNEQETAFTDNSFMFPTTGRGFTRSRVDYNRPLLLNLGYLAGHIDKVLRFSRIEGRIKDVARIVKTSKSFAQVMDGFDPTVRNDMLVPWLQRTAMQMVSIPSKGQAGQFADRVFRYLRTATGMQMMVANITNTLQQFTGFPIAAVQVKPKYLRNALWQYIKQPTETAKMVCEASDYMKTRMKADTYELMATMDELLLNPNKYEKLQDFASKHGYFMQSATQGVVDTIAWIGAYNEAIEQQGGLVDEKDAVRRADSVVRMTQGSFSPEDMARIEGGSAFMRFFTQFYSYFNMQANLLGTEFLNASRNLGAKKGAGRMLYIYTLGFMVPAVLSELIVQAAGGFDTGDDDDFGLWDAMRLFFNAQARPMAAAVPVAGQLATATLNRFNNKYYDDRISTSPAISMLESSVNAPFAVYKAIAEDGSWKRASRDLLTMLGAVTRLPLGQMGKPVGYALDVAQGRAEPENVGDYARGLLSGKDVNKK